MDEIAVLEDGVSSRKHARAETVDEGHARIRRQLDVGDGMSVPTRMRRHLGQEHLTARIAVLLEATLWQQATHDLSRRPRHGGDSGNAEALVDLGAARVIDAGDHVLDAVGLASDASREDVGVVSATYRRESVGALDPRILESFAIEADALDRRAGESGTQSAKRLRILVDDRDGMTGIVETVRKK